MVWKRKKRTERVSTLRSRYYGWNVDHLFQVPLGSLRPGLQVDGWLQKSTNVCLQNNTPLFFRLGINPN